MTSNGYDTFSSIPALKAAYSGYFFTRGAMRAFNSRIETGIIRGSYFVTSEQYEDEARLYTVRQAVRQEDGTLSIETVGDFQAYETKAAARAALMEAAKS